MWRSEGARLVSCGLFCLTSGSFLIVIVWCLCLLSGRFFPLLQVSFLEKSSGFPFGSFFAGWACGWPNTYRSSCDVVLVTNPKFL